MPVMLNNFFFWQTQYIFVHEVLFEAFRYKSHAILYREFAKEFKKLYGGDQPTNENPLRMEYNVIIFSCIITCNINVTLIKHVNLRLYSNLSVWLKISTLITHFKRLFWRTSSRWNPATHSPGTKRLWNLSTKPETARRRPCQVIITWFLDSCPFYKCHILSYDVIIPLSAWSHGLRSCRKPLT